MPDSSAKQVSKYRINVIKQRCKGCGFCVEFCPRQVLQVSSEFNDKGYHPPEAAREHMCTNCGTCSLICPDFAIYITSVEEDEVLTEVDERRADAK